VLYEIALDGNRLRDSGFGISLTGKPPSVNVLDAVCDCYGFRRLGDRIGLGLLLRSCFACTTTQRLVS
jgi:hypothetical protein